MKVALDIDGTISEHPEFFAVLASALGAAGHRVLVLTYRDPARAEATAAQLAAWGVPYDDLVIAGSLEGKGELCAAHGVDLLFDDQDECIAAVPEGVLVCKVRNGGNLDFGKRRWLSTARLTELIRKPPPPTAVGLGFLGARVAGGPLVGQPVGPYGWGCPVAGAFAGGQPATPGARLYWGGGRLPPPLTERRIRCRVRSCSPSSPPS